MLAFELKTLLSAILADILLLERGSRKHVTQLTGIPLVLKAGHCSSVSLNVKPGLHHRPERQR